MRTGYGTDLEVEGLVDENSRFVTDSREGVRIKKELTEPFSFDEVYDVRKAVEIELAVLKGVERRKNRVSLPRNILSEIEYFGIPLPDDRVLRFTPIEDGSPCSRSDRRYIVWEEDLQLSSDIRAAVKSKVPFTTRKAVEVKKQIFGIYHWMPRLDGDVTPKEIDDAFRAVLNGDFELDMNVLARKGLPLSRKRALYFVSSSVARFGEAYNVYADDRNRMDL